MRKQAQQEQEEVFRLVRQKVPTSICISVRSADPVSAVFLTLESPRQVEQRVEQALLNLLTRPSQCSSLRRTWALPMGTSR